MKRWTRRNVFSASALLPISQSLIARENYAPTAGISGNAIAAKTPKPFVHVTDLFRPHDDPDDHWDLATGYALAQRGELDLAGILTDNPENVEEIPELIHTWDRSNGGIHVARSPDVAAVAQLNYLTDRAVPVATGPVWSGNPGEKVHGGNPPKELRGVNMLLDVLKKSPRPVAILSGGSCQNVAIAGMKEPRLFAEKCAAIYLNAGSGSKNQEEQSDKGNVEWNVRLNRGAYAAMFELPCPIYWMPCFHGFSPGGAIIGEYGTAWRFRQGDLLPYLSNNLQAFFAYVLDKESGTNWLSYLLSPVSKDAVTKYFENTRCMFSTAGFLHAAGKTVTSDGAIVPLESTPRNAVYEFISIDVRCSETGITQWQETKEQTGRYIFRVRDQVKYPEAMTKALKSVLLNLP